MSAWALLMRRRSSLADLLPVVAFSAATAITSTVVAGTAAFYGRMLSLGLGPGGDANTANFDSSNPESYVIFFIFLCALLACVLLVPNAVALGGAAARLSLARREKDLATARLVGGTRSQVAGIAMADVALQALIGALIGVAAHLLLAYPLATLNFGIAPFTPGDLILPWWALVLTPFLFALLAAGSAALTLTGVAMSPLGIARGAHVVRMSVIRLLVWLVLIVLFLLVAKIMPSVDGVSMGMIAAIVMGSIGLMVLGVNIAGPFLVWVSARIVAALAPFPSLIVGARRLAADPRAGWRAVSGVSVALVVAGFASMLSMVTKTGVGIEDQIFTQAITTGAYLTLAIASVLAAVSTGVTQAARVIDQAPQYRAQHVAGATVGQLHKARMAEIAIPVILSLSVASLMVALIVLSLFSSSVGQVTPAIYYGISIVSSLGLVVLSAMVSSPLVARAARSAARTAG